LDFGERILRRRFSLGFSNVLRALRIFKIPSRSIFFFSRFNAFSSGSCSLISTFSTDNHLSFKLSKSSRIISKTPPLRKEKVLLAGSLIRTTITPMILSAFEALLASVFPSECQNCGQTLTPSRTKLCQGCFAHLAEHELAWEDAWYPTPIHSIRSAWSALRYRGPVKDYLQRIKFKHEFYLLEPLAQSASGLFEALTSETDYHAMIPMPIDLPGRWNRRFNQTEVLASCLRSAKKIPIWSHILYKRWGFRSQHGLSKEERKWNLFGAFGVKQAHFVRGKTFLLIDDIVTTGATASEAARLLLNHGAKQVDLFTLARSEKQVR